MGALKEFELEPARLADAAALAAMSREWIEHGLPWRWTPRAVAGLIRDPQAEVVVARRPEGPVGFGAMKYYFEQQSAHLLLLAVDPESRRAGLGSTLCDWLETLARRGGITRCQLEVRADNPGACAFYEHRGYETLQHLPGYYRQLIDALRMQRRFGAT